LVVSKVYSYQKTESTFFTFMLKSF
jgi:hypothetical protein